MSTAITLSGGLKQTSSLASSYLLTDTRPFCAFLFLRPSVLLLCPVSISLSQALCSFFLVSASLSPLLFSSFTHLCSLTHIKVGSLVSRSSRQELKSASKWWSKNYDRPQFLQCGHTEKGGTSSNSSKNNEKGSSIKKRL